MPRSYETRVRVVSWMRLRPGPLRMSRRLLAAIPLIALVAACSSSETGGNRDKFTAWYVDAARQLHAAGFAVSIAVVPRSSELPGTSGYHRWLFDSWRGGYDLAAIG